ncbi:MAG: DNA alkylation repair protein [Candidatus Pristimantibacillus lignocellulolyticus]|uniref:DNA alkylation repair protein n=1 Tax=Candidatus Pristimantibacillus lignocellulolyticus TaxID=2994561 RepID=A0A9J6ZJL9_9BACL|nr:MAG: DNA alkylation repair protein [Candidatus Pristimantibacillus lignocellulolyticus]
MDFQMVMQELEALGKERTKKIYQSNGAQEPLFGVNTGEMKPLFRKIKLNQPLAEQLYATGNYDAMYFAGIIAEPKAMTEADFERWIDAAYFYMISDFIVAVTLSETDIAQQVSDKWIESGEELKMSAGWSCYCWLLGNRPDREFSESKIAKLLELAKNTIHDAPERAKSSINNFIYTVGVSYLPLHDLAFETAKIVGPVSIKSEKKKENVLIASEQIQKFIDKRDPGFKRKHVRC